MSTVSTTMLAGLLLGSLLAGSGVLLVAAVRGWQPNILASRGGTSGRSSWAGIGSARRVGAAAAAATGVGAATRWPVAALVAAVGVLLWPKMFGAGPLAALQVARLEALATWTESLRDSIAGSVGLDEAIQHSVTAAPAVLMAPLDRLIGRLRLKVPLPQALLAFAEEFEDSSADLVVAALVLNSSLRGPGLVSTLSALSLAAREEIDLRRRIEEGRKSLRRTAMVILGVTGSFAGGIAILSRDYVAPYGTPVGQVVLALVLAVFAGGLVWIRSAANLEPPPRFLASADVVERLLSSRAPGPAERTGRTASSVGTVSDQRGMT